MEWYRAWFDSPFYHILYRERDNKEAKFFLDHLISYLKPSPESKFLDVACGQGRHSIYLNSKGYFVNGIDLSPTNIREASKMTNESLQFETHDMRDQYLIEKYDYVLNLFTSFGFFEKDQEHQQALTMMSRNLKSGGKLILDFLNPTLTVKNLIESEVKEVEGIRFNIRRSYSDGIISKIIEFNDGSNGYQFEEQVKVIKPEEFLNYFGRAGLTVNSIFGNYSLEDFDQNESQRLIFIATK